MVKAKKQKGVGGPNIPADNSALERQVMEGDTVTIADVKQFIVDDKKKQEDYCTIADLSWNEIERRNKLGKLIQGDLSRARRLIKFPLWWSCWKIRKPITFSRLPIPVLKDTQGDDPYGRTACIIGERLVKGILKTFDAFDEFSLSIDDFLVTDFGWGRWCYKSEIVEEEEKIRLQMVQQPPPPPQMGPDGQPMGGPPQQMPPLFIAPDGQQVPEENVQEDDLGPYFATGAMIKVENEEIYFDAGPYPGLLVEADVTKWSKVTRLEFEQPYNYREFESKFGRSALDKLSQADIKDYKDGKKPIMVYEFHDKVLKEVRWLADTSDDFFQPIEMDDVNTEALKEVKGKKPQYDNKDLYGLSKFFPCTKPLVINQSTRSFWPTPEFFQIQDLLDNTSSIVTRMTQLLKAVRIRFLFDSSVKQLAPLIGENWAGGEGTGIGVPNLQQTLMNNKGDLSTLVAYFPVDVLMKALQSMYVAFRESLDMFYNVTGFSDLIRGQTSENDKTYGERQLEGKFALNRMEPYQEKVQTWLKDNYHLGMEMALKMFKDETLDEYITPQTLDPEDKQRYVPSLDLIRNNRRGRFRMDFETDSTISINQEWKKKQAIETANAITKMMESVAKTAQDMPELADAELRIMKHVVGELTDGKLFMDEITDAIQKTIDKVNQPKEPEFNAEKAKIDLETRRLSFDEQKAMTDDRMTQMQMQMDGQIEQAKIAQKDRLDGFALQLEQIKMQTDAGIRTAELNQKASDLQASIELQQQDLDNKRAELMVTLQNLTDKTQLKQMELLLDSRVAEQKHQLEQLYFGVEKQKIILDEKEKYLTEARLQSEHQITQAEHQLHALTSLTEVHKTLQEMRASPTPVVVHLEQPKKAKIKRTGKIIRDTGGDPTHIEIHDEELP